MYSRVKSSGLTLRFKLNIRNLQNLPSGSKYGKIIKSCFEAPKGWLFCGADFSALEDKIGAILSKDKMKILEFSRELDGHSVRALKFFPEELPDIDINDIDAVNRIKIDYPKIRSSAKAPSFALQYNGTWVTIKHTLGCSDEKAKAIEKGYHELYSGLAEFSQKNVEFAIRNGYVDCAFGLRVRTPLLQRVKGGRLDSKASAEGRSASNAVTQSWGMLSNRASIEFRDRLEQSPYVNDVRMINVIHDAIYLLVRNSPEVVHWVNTNLIECMEWQDHPLIRSDEVKLGAELDIGLDWAHQFTLTNRMTLEEIRNFMKEHGLIS